jgi:uncharacterized delta-60 repeat protein
MKKGNLSRRAAVQQVGDVFSTRKGSVRRAAGMAAAVLLSFAAVAAPVSASSSGGLDGEFGTPIGSFPVVANDSDRFIDVASISSKRAYAVGNARSGGNGFFALTRILKNGAVDPSFGTGGTALLDIVPGTSEAARGVGVQEDGKIVISGQALSLEPGADPRDVDIYVARFNTDGSQDMTFAGGAGTLRVNLSDGALVAPAFTNYRTDQTYGLRVGRDDEIVLVSARGPDLTDRPGRFDRDFAIIRLTPDGVFDPDWDGDGIAIVDTMGAANPTDDANNTVQSLNESPRQAIVESNGRVVVASYSEGEDGRAIPRLIRFKRNGALDSSFGEGGIATVPRDFFHATGGPSAEVEFYAVAAQGSSYVVCGYGRPDSTVAVDAISARFRSNGRVSKSYGDDGAVVVDLAGQEDRCRDLEVLKDRRVILSGSANPAAVPGNIDAMLVALTKDGQRQSGFGTDGVLTIDFGGTSDSLYGVQATHHGERAIAVGFKGGGTANTSSTGSNPADDGRAVRYRIR